MFLRDTVPRVSQVAGEARLLNVETGEIRRVPYSGYTAKGTGFSTDRRSVYMIGGFADGQGNAIVTVDLESAAMSTTAIPVDGGQAQIVDAVLAPDGGRMLLMRRDLVEGVMDHFFELQPVILDLKTGKTEAVGKRLRGYGMSWLADGSGLVYIDAGDPLAGGGFGFGDETEKPQPTLLRLWKLDGSHEAIATGIDAVLVLPDGNLLVRRTSDSLWYTCRADGSEQARLADGMPKWSDPAVSPDGKSILWLSTEPEDPHPSETRVWEGPLGLKLLPAHIYRTKAALIPFGEAAGTLVLDTRERCSDPVWR
jgi:hypothetical protein